MEGSSTLAASDRYAVIASYGAVPTVSTSLESMVQRLEECGYTVIVSRASDNPAPLQWSEDFTGSALVLRKPNIGYDFGSWAVALKRFPQVRRAPYVLLVNDSLVGPFGSLQTMVDDFEQAGADVWAATNTTQFFPHIQSFFMGFRAGALDLKGLRDFWFSLRVETDKQAIIHAYELGLSRLLFGEAFTMTACFKSERVVDTGLNPSVVGWKRLLDLGFPFVKRELITNPSLAPDGHLIVEDIHTRFGVDPRTWI
ncbi:rhamnan synthesis F family protein [Glaciihabitans tibetensis]|uniref:rhamnan synthesis F family protein n=1 Tax=Glaciihabitans tibetensis TaxID=1266600 RepID=UPI0015E735F4|nr:rhamnan synthesis F family protein [Glaciihabitans tibetensis]